MKLISVTLILKVEEDVSIEEVIDDIQVDLYNKIESIVDVTGEEIREVGE